MTGEKLHPTTRYDLSHSFLFKNIGDHVGDEDIIDRLPTGQAVLCASKAPVFCPKCEANTKNKVACQLKKLGLV